MKKQMRLPGTQKQTGSKKSIGINRNYVCPGCGGPIPDDVDEPVLCDSCYVKKEFERLVTASGFKEGHKHMTFANFKAESSELKSVVKKIEAFLKAMEAGKLRNLLVYGQNGVGKTHLAAAIGWRWLHDLQPIRFIPGFKLLFKIKATFGDRYNSGASTEEIIEEFAGYPTLIIDDLGAENATEWAKETLFMIFYERNIRLLKTIVTSNLDRVGLAEKFTDRISSRLSESAAIIEMPGSIPDYRLKN